MTAQTDAHQRCRCRRSAFMTFLPQLNDLATGDCVGICCLLRPPILNRGGNRKIAPFSPRRRAPRSRLHVRRLNWTNIG